jgi:hypothetical protein
VTTTADQALAQAQAHAAWLPPEALRALGARRVAIHGEGLLAETVAREAEQACARFGGAAAHHPGNAAGRPTSEDGARHDLVLSLDGSRPATDAEGTPLGDEGFLLTRSDGVTSVLAGGPHGLGPRPGDRMTSASRSADCRSPSDSALKPLRVSKTSRLRLSPSTVGATPPGVAKTTSHPAPSKTS